MAQNDGQRRMLFDVRGKRRHVIRVVYAILALLMAGSLFLVVGPFNLGEIADSGNSGDAAEALEDRAERIEKRLVKDPTNEDLQIVLVRTRLNAGNSLAEVDPETGVPTFTPEAKAQLELGLQTWADYIDNAKGDPNPAVAQLVSSSYFSLAESAGSIKDIETNIEQAAAAQRLAAAGKRDANSLSTLAIYEFFAGNFAAGDKATKEATQLATSPKEAKKQLAAYRERAKKWQKEKKKLLKEEGKRGREELESGFSGGLGTSGLTP